MKRRYLLAAALSLGFASLGTEVSAQQQIQRRNPNNGNPVFAGYLEVEFSNASRGLKGAQAPADYNVINYSFCTDKSGGNGNINIVPSPAYGTRQDLINDVRAVIAQGGVAQCSLGGANSDVRLDNPQAIANFVNSLNRLYDEVPFNGIDIDLEGASFRLDPGDRDPRNPTTPSVRNFITALRMFLDTQQAKNPQFFLTMAPETFFVQRAIRQYGPTDLGIPAGAALPFIEAFRDDLDVIYVQNYNTGDHFGLDGNIYATPSTDFLVSQQEILLQDFTVGGMTGQFTFKALRPEQVAIGLPATPQSAGSGFIAAQQVVQALDYLTQGAARKVGTYVLRNPAGYQMFGGIMAFSVNQDVSPNGNNGEFSRIIGARLRTLRSGTASEAAESQN